MDPAPSPTALDAFIASMDLVSCVASCLPSRAAMRSLCLVSRWWNHSFSPYLYSHVVFHDGNAHILRDPELLEIFVSNPRLAYAKALSFRLIEGSWAIGNHREVGRLADAPGYGRLGDIRCWAGVYNDSMQRIALKTPSIYRFEWENWPISQSLLNTLEESCTSLRDVFIVYPNLARFSKTERFYRHQAYANAFDEVKPKLVPLPAPEFQNLRQLYLYEITGDLDLWIPKIATMLGKSRFLEELGLSLSAECERQYALSGNSQTFLDFFKLLVQRYKDQGDDPLRLRVLKLGYGVLLNATEGPSPDDPLEEAEYLFDLVQRAYLEELYVDNDLDTGCPLNIRKTTGQISWSLVSPSFLPNIKRFTFTSISARSREWLLAHPDPTFVKSLAMGIGTERLAYSYVDGAGALQRVHPSQVVRRIGQLGDRTFFLRSFRDVPVLPVRSATLLVLKPCHPADLLALATCPWVRSLVVCLQKQVSCRAPALRGLVASLPPAMEHLWIRVGMDYPLASTQDTANHRGNAVRVGEGGLVDEQLHLHGAWREKWAALAGVVAASANCPSKYLKVGHLAWRVCPRAKGAKAAVLEPVDRWDDEADGPEVFRYNDPVRRDRPY